MKKIAIVSKKVGIGGVERSLLSMLKNIDYNDFEVDLYLPEIDNINKIPKNVHIVKMESSLQNMFSTYFMIHPIQFFRIIFSLLLLKVNKNLNYVYQLISSKYFYKRVKKTYDVVISYDGPLGFSTFYALYNLKGKKKKIWIHGNVIKDNIPSYIVEKYYSKFDELVFVSKSVRQEFLEQYEDFGSKSKVFYNYLDEEEIQSLARQEVEIDRECLNIVTVARISYEKGIDLALESAKRLKEKGISFKWYVCGDGVLYGEIKKQVSSERLDDCFILLGEKNNPYPYIKKCDIYVQPSRTEGFCTTTNEAKVLNKVIVTTDVGGMREQFVDRKTALITNINSQAIYEAIMELINSPKFANEIRENLSNTEINFNTSTIHEILS